MTRVLLAALMLCGCAATPTSDDYTVTIRLKVVDYDLRHAGKNAYAIAWPDATPCLILVERKHYKNEVLGHEFRHCLDGYWHK